MKFQFFLQKTVSLVVLSLGVAGCSGTAVQPSSNSSSSNSSSSSSSASSSSNSSSSSTGGAVHATCPSTNAAAFQYFAAVIPGKVEAENFDINGFSDSSDTNEGGAYRIDTPVDVKTISGGYAVTQITTGEYLEYSLYLQNPGTYDVYVRSGAVEAGRTINITQCDTPLIEAFKIPLVAGWGQFKTWKAGSVKLAAGIQKIRISAGEMDSLDLDWIHIGPYTGTIDRPDPVVSSSSSTSSSGGRVFPKFFVGNITTNGQVRADFKTYWNQITPENEGKWPSVESVRDQYNWAGVDRAYNYAEQNGILFKQHTFIWGASSPSWFNSISSEEMQAEINAWFHDFCTRYPKTAIIDVVNEATPGHQPAAYAQNAYGTEWVAELFKVARRECPNAILVLNDYNVLSWDTDKFIAMARNAAASGNVDAIGLQAHGLEKFTTTQLKTAMDKVENALHLPFYITEYDIAKTNDQEQLNIMKDQFPLFYNDPRIKGITFWGYVVGATWVSGSGLIQQDGTFRPAMTWLMDYIKQNPK